MHPHAEPSSAAAGPSVRADAPASAAAAPDWDVVIPVKDARSGKSRLRSSWPAADEALSRAIADDTIRATVHAVGAGRVVLVTSDPDLVQRWASAGVRVVEDPGAGLNAAVVRGIEAALARRCAAEEGEAGAGAGVAVLLGDLPALVPEDLRTALAAASRHAESFVPDRDGTGTVLRCGRAPAPRFGAGSASAHERDGAARLDLDLPRLRTDVDDLPGLREAVALGVGPSTALALRDRPLG
jgi:2-phospho-L-lactate guanylyltransferase